MVINTNPKIKIFRESLPATIHGATALTGGAYIVVINKDDKIKRQLQALMHELAHIMRGDFKGVQDVNEIETRARERSKLFRGFRAQP